MFLLDTRFCYQKQMDMRPKWVKNSLVLNNRASDSIITLSKFSRTMFTKPLLPILLENKEEEYCYHKEEFVSCSKEDVDTF